MSVQVATLGLFILDTFEWRDERGTVLDRHSDEIGGGGCYAALGARMWLLPQEVGILVDRGNDWTPELQAKLDAFGPMWTWRAADRPTTRALNLYTGEHRDFQYLNERARLEPKDLPDSLSRARWLHFVCSPTRAITILSQLDKDISRRPCLCYEPIPDRCCPDELDSLRRVLPQIDVFSPNHEEAAAFFGIDAATVARQGKAGIEASARRFLDEGAKRYVVIRSGALGAFAVERGGPGFWMPAYHRDPARVVDVTGGGNTFLGGLMAGFARHPDDLRTAVAKASVSASFIIEQFGLARLAEGDDGQERWNGERVEDRLAELLERQARQRE